MAEHLIRILARATATCGVLVATGVASGAAMAQADPTRPPDSSGAQPTGGGTVASMQTFEVKSILLSGRRTEALIGDKFVRIGDAVGNAHVVKISEGEVVLRNENGLRTLKLFPGIEKRIIAAEDGRATGMMRDSQENSKK
jgi:MSHA biogenesis protein MshK